MRPRHKGDFYDKPNSYTFLNLRPARLRPARARPARVRPARARPTRVRPARARPARVRPARARPTRVRPARPRPARVRLPSKRPNATRPKTYLRPKSITTKSINERGPDEMSQNYVKVKKIVKLDRRTNALLLADQKVSSSQTAFTWNL